MKGSIRFVNRREKGQTLVVALIILGLLLILGFVFLGVVTRNIRNQGRNQERTVANDLAEAGIRYAHAQLLHSELGADWRGNPITLQPITGNTNYTADPDALYLRPGTGIAFPGNPGIIDLGGPDGLGSYIRLNYQNGRSLIRVRWAPSDANVFSSSPTGAIRNPGAVRNYTIIESVGREGRVNLQDPTTLQQTGGVQYRGITTVAQLTSAIQGMQRAEAKEPTSRKLRAFASIGIIESAHFITDIDRTSRAADIGVPANLGASFGGSDVGPSLPTYLGTTAKLTNPSNGAPTSVAMPIGGGLYSNAPLRVHGHVELFLNQAFGEGWNVADVIRPADADAALRVHRTKLQSGSFTSDVIDLASNNFDSRSSSFSTQGGLIRDGVATTDASGYARSVMYKAPPLIDSKDPDTGELRYVLMSRESGTIPSGASVNSGRFGHGRNVYVDNSADRQISTDETGRESVGSGQSLTYDWLNPNNGDATSGWQGPFYVPRGAFVQLTSDGFIITRDGRAPDDQKFWKAPNGQLPGAPSNPIQTPRIRYRIGMANGRAYIVNSFTPGVNIDNPSYALGQPFNGVLCFEGNARVRGVIPTDIQLTIVSMGTIYIEGSITKGVIGNSFTASESIAPTAIGRRLTRPSKSMLMLAAKDYVAVNTTQFVGPSPSVALKSYADPTQGADNFASVQMDATGGWLGFVFDLPIDPATDEPYATGYKEFGTGTALPTRLVVTHTMANGAAAGTFLSWNVNPMYADTSTSNPSSYFFPRTPIDPTVARPVAIFSQNAMANFNITGDPTYYPVYGLGGEVYQRYGQFETVAFPLVNPSTTTLTDGLLTSNGSEGLFTLFTQGTEYSTDARRNESLNEIVFRPNSTDGASTNDYLLARAALVPHDIRIEASIYAENGSFFIIPGPWFNGNPNDTRKEFEDKITTLGSRALADQDRLEAFGSTPIMPFFGEPIDVRIQVVGAVSENMPPPMSEQSEWLRKWGWMPRQLAAMHDYTTGQDISIPATHVPADFQGASQLFVPNFSVTYDTMLATARINGFVATNNPYDTVSPAIRVDDYGRALPPMPRLPVSPTLAYFGEVK